MLRQADGSVDPTAIIATYEERRSERGPVINGMQELLRTYNGEIALPLPELNASEHSLVANLVVQGVDAMSQRISSIMPDTEYASLRPGIKLADKAAADRRSVNLSWWDVNEMRAKLGRRARHYAGHGVSSVVIRPNVDWQAPQWHLRSPLETYPAETTNPDDVQPHDVIYVYNRTYSWLKSHYPLVGLDFHIEGQTRASTQVEIIEYVDCYGVVMLARNINEVVWGGGSQRKVRVLESVDYDYGGILPASVLGRPTLGGKVMGMFDQNVPMYRMQAKLAALELAAIQRGIFPEVWFVGANGQEPTVVSYPRPFDGKPGVITDGSMQVLNVQPTYTSPQMRGDLERSQRLTARIPAEQGGESASNVRTGKRGDSILSQTVDFPVQEAQDDFCRALEAENRAAIAVQKYHFGRKSLSFYVSGNKQKGRGEYVPNELFTTDSHDVKYPYSGADVNTLSINIMQLTGSGLMSKDTSRKKHPLIEDAEHEGDTILTEALVEAVLAGIQQRVASPDPAQALPIGDVVKLIQLVKRDRKELPEAWEQVQQEAQERQSQQMPQGAPETMPGAEAAGAGAEMPTVPEPEQGTQNLASLFNAMRQPRPPRQAVSA